MEFCSLMADLVKDHSTDGDQWLEFSRSREFERTMSDVYPIARSIIGRFRKLLETGHFGFTIDDIDAVARQASVQVLKNHRYPDKNQIIGSAFKCIKDIFREGGIIHIASNLMANKIYDDSSAEDLSENLRKKVNALALQILDPVDLEELALTSKDMTLSSRVLLENRSLGELLDLAVAGHLLTEDHRDILEKCYSADRTRNISEIASEYGQTPGAVSHLKKFSSEILRENLLYLESLDQVQSGISKIKNSRFSVASNALYYMGLMDYQGAEVSAETILNHFARHPRSGGADSKAEVCIVMSILARKNGDFEKALKYTERAKDSERWQGEVFAQQGEILRKQGNFDKAVEKFKLSLERDPMQSGRLCSLAKSLMRLERFQEAQDAANAAMNLTPSDPVVARVLASLELMSMGLRSNP